ALTASQRDPRKAKAKVLQGEAETHRQLAGVRHRLGAIGEEALHGGATLHEVLVVAREEAARRLEGGVLADAREHVEQRTIAARDEPRLVGGERSHAQPLGLLAQPLVARFLPAAQVTLQLREDVVAAVDRDETLEETPGSGPALALERAG